MNKKDLEHFEAKLLKEKALLQEELGGISKVDPHNPGNYQATVENMEVDTADENEVADKLEELEDNEAIVEQLEKQLHEVDAALEKIKNGTYGVCEISGEEIEKERLEANPSARTSLKHMK